MVPTRPPAGTVGEGWEEAAAEPEVQRYLPYVRTDLDRFSDVLVNQLSRHGYAVARHVLPQELRRWSGRRTPGATRGSFNIRAADRQKSGPNR